MNCSRNWGCTQTESPPQEGFAKVWSQCNATGLALQAQGCNLLQQVRAQPTEWDLPGKEKNQEIFKRWKSFSCLVGYKTGNHQYSLSGRLLCNTKLHWLKDNGEDSNLTKQLPKLQHQLQFTISNLVYLLHQRVDCFCLWQRLRKICDLCKSVSGVNITS